jgi:hypothetical protein
MLGALLGGAIQSLTLLSDGASKFCPDYHSSWYQPFGTHKCAASQQGISKLLPGREHCLDAVA